MSFTIMNVNVGQLPWPIGMKHRRERSRRLVHTILNLENKPDIICFQEMFTKSARNIVVKGLKEQYPFNVVDNSKGKWMIGVNSGLAIVSRYRIVASAIHTYTKTRGVDNLAKKGVLGARIAMNYSDYRNRMHRYMVTVFTTHIQAGIGREPCICKYFDTNDMSSNQLKRLQIEEASHFINKFKEPGDNAIVFCGDFNVEPDVDYLPDILNKDNDLFDTFNSERSQLQGTVIGETDKRIDYQFVNDDGVQNAWSIIIPEIGASITDHYAVYGKVIFS